MSKPETTFFVAVPTGGAWETLPKSEVRKRLREGSLRESHLVWHPSDQSWKPARSFPDLKKSSPVPAPSSPQPVPVAKPPSAVRAAPKVAVKVSVSTAQPIPAAKAHPVVSTSAAPAPVVVKIATPVPAIKKPVASPAVATPQAAPRTEPSAKANPAPKVVALQSSSLVQPSPSPSPKPAPKPAAAVPVAAAVPRPANSAAVKVVPAAASVAPQVSAKAEPASKVKAAPKPAVKQAPVAVHATATPASSPATRPTSSTAIKPTPAKPVAAPLNVLEQMERMVERQRKMQGVYGVIIVVILLLIPFLNWLLIQRPMTSAIARSEFKNSVKVSGHYGFYVSPIVLMIQLQEIPAGMSGEKLMDLLSTLAVATRSSVFHTVALVKGKDVKYVMRGEVWSELAHQRAEPAPIRAKLLVSNLYLPNGKQALSDQSDNLAILHEQKNKLFLVFYETFVGKTGAPANPQ
ncbi:MAG: hypothetical protein HY360_03560 [Verrucomicrobia bacterium]|nr:hypothetical protein [Verrucomicrobiota bacterium]